MPAPLFTVGHSTHSTEHFLDLLRMNGVSAVADVRSRPYSRVNPQFNREALQGALESAGLVYRFLGRELGARTEDPACYINGKVQYDRLAQTPLFRRGLARIVNGTRAHLVALLCAERDPITCHRMVLVCHALRSRPLDIFHIRADGSLESNAEAERRMVDVVGLPASDLYTSISEAVEEAYHLQAQRIAWVEPSSDQPEAATRNTDAEASL